MTTATAQTIINHSRNASGKIDVRRAIHNLVTRGHSEMEAAAHLISVGCPTDLAYRRAQQEMANRVTAAKQHYLCSRCNGSGIDPSKRDANGNRDFCMTCGGTGVEAR